MINLYTNAYIAPLLIIIKRWKQPKCPSTNEWINKLWYIHAIEHSAIKNEWNTDTCYNLNEPQRHQAKWKKPDTEGLILCDSFDISIKGK